MSLAAAMEVLGSLVLEDGRPWGAAAEAWQREDAEAVLTPESETPMHFQTRPRGGSKTVDTGGDGLAMLLTQFPPRAQGFVLAADADQAALLVDAAAGFVARTPDLAGGVEVQTRRIVARGSGAAINVLPADAASAFGVRPFVVFVDELAQWGSTAGPRRLWEAAFSSVPKVAGCRLVVLTSAGDPGHWSYRVLETAKASPRWRVHEVPGPVPWIDPGALDEQRRMLTESQFARLHLNRWTAPEDRLTTIDDVTACMKPGGVIAPIEGIRYVVGVDLGVRSDRTVIAVCHVDHEPETGASCVVLDRMEAFEPTKGQSVDLGAVEETIAVASRSYNRAHVVVDPWQALSMCQRLRAEGVRVEEFTFSQASVGRLALTLYRLLRDHQLDLPDDDDLRDELANVRLIETSPGVVRLDHDPDKHDDRAIALALAAVHLLGTSPVRRRLICRAVS